MNRRYQLRKHENLGRVILYKLICYKCYECVGEVPFLIEILFKTEALNQLYVIVWASNSNWV